MFNGATFMADEAAATTFKSEFSWAQTWIPKIKRYVGPMLLREGTLYEDRREATDLIVLRASGFRIACRVRRPGFAKFKQEVTITAKRESGAACEWDKLIEAGFGDWFFYGHATNVAAQRGDILPRHLIDLSVARDWIKENHGPLLGPNKDAVGKRCWFYAVNVIKLNSDLNGKALLASRTEYPTTAESSDSEDTPPIPPTLTLEQQDWVDSYTKAPCAIHGMEEDA